MPQELFQNRCPGGEKREKEDTYEPKDGKGKGRGKQAKDKHIAQTAQKRSQLSHSPKAKTSQRHHL